MAGGRFTAAAVILVGAVGAGPQPDEALHDPTAAIADIAANLKRCESAPSNMNTMAQNGCYGDALEDADVILARTKKSVLSRLAAHSAHDPDAEESNRVIARRLEAAQSAWSNYRQSECSFVATDMLGGSGEKMSEMACEFEKTQARIRELAAWLGDNH